MKNRPRIGIEQNDAAGQMLLLRQIERLVQKKLMAFVQAVKIPHTANRLGKRGNRRVFDFHDFHYHNPLLQRYTPFSSRS